MPEKSKTKQDAAEIKRLLGLDALDWARYPNGDLSFIALNGQKFVYTQAQLDELDQQRKAAAKKPAKKAPTKKGAK